MGTQFGYSMLWVMVVLTVGMAVVQEMCSRMRAVTGKGLSDLIRETFPLRLTVFIMFIFLLANGGVIVSEFLGIAAALNLFGIPSWIGHGVRAFSLHPGSIVSTGLSKYLSPEVLSAAGIVDENETPILDPARGLKTVEQGAGPASGAQRVRSLTEWARSIARTAISLRSCPRRWQQTSLARNRLA